MWNGKSRASRGWRGVRGLVVSSPSVIRRRYVVLVVRMGSGVVEGE